MHIENITKPLYLLVFTDFSKFISLLGSSCLVGFSGSGRLRHVQLFGFAALVLLDQGQLCDVPYVGFLSVLINQAGCGLGLLCWVSLVGIDGPGLLGWVIFAGSGLFVWEEFTGWVCWIWFAWDTLFFIRTLSLRFSKIFRTIYMLISPFFVFVLQVKFIGSNLEN